MAWSNDERELICELVLEETADVTALTDALEHNNEGPAVELRDLWAGEEGMGGDDYEDMARRIASEPLFTADELFQECAARAVEAVECARGSVPQVVLTLARVKAEYLARLGGVSAIAPETYALEFGQIANAVGTDKDDPEFKRLISVVESQLPSTLD